MRGQLPVHPERLHGCKMTTASTSRSLLEPSSRQLVRHLHDQGLALGLTASQRVTTQASLAQVHFHTHQPRRPVLRHLPTLTQHLDTTAAITPTQVDQPALWLSLQVQLPPHREGTPSRSCLD